MQFGEGAGTEKVLQEMRECVNKFGGLQIAHDMKLEKSLKIAIDKGSSWFKDKTILLVCDDLWPSSDSDNDFGFKTEITAMLQFANSSCRILFSTR